MCVVDPHGDELGYRIPCLLVDIKIVMMCPPLEAIGSLVCSSLKTGSGSIAIVEVFGDVDIPLVALDLRVAISCSSNTSLL